MGVIEAELRGASVTYFFKGTSVFDSKICADLSFEEVIKYVRSSDIWRSVITSVCGLIDLIFSPV